MLERISDDFVLCFRDIMVGTRHTPKNSGVSDDEIGMMIHDEVAATIHEAFPNMFGSIKITLIKTFDERYVVVSEATAAAATVAVADARP